jgi:hypothetical protein
MNIFVLDTDPRRCAEMHCDKHVVKMIVETAQLLCGAHHMISDRDDIPYRLSHKNHPCSIWVRESRNNYRWLCELGLELCAEYTRRYGKIHKTEEVLKWCARNFPELPEIDMTDFRLAMPESCQIHSDSVLNYREYYIREKVSFCTWKTSTPEWFSEALSQ